MENNTKVSQGLDTERIHRSVLDIVEKFRYEIMRCINCPIILECQYPKKRLITLKADAKSFSEDVYEEEIELDNSAENVLRAQNKRDYTYNQYIKDNAHKVLANDRCVFERGEVMNALQKFVDAGYDILLDFDTFGKNYYFDFPSVRRYDSKRVVAVAR